jgi:hypothetical protein
MLPKSLQKPAGQQLRVTKSSRKTAVRTVALP